MSADSFHRRAYRRLVRGARALVPGARPAEPVDVAYALLVSDDVHNFVSRAQMDLVRACGPGPRFHQTPHITLKLGFRAPSVEAFERHFDRLAASVEPFEIRAGNIDFFDEGIVFLNVEPGDALHRLRLRVVGELADDYGVAPYDIEGDRFHFHVTVAYDVSSSQLARARRVFAGSADQFRFVPEAAALMCHAGEQWIVYKRARLGKRP